MKPDTHPIDLFLVLLLEMTEGICWVINELAGHHNTDTTSTTAVGTTTTDEPISVTAARIFNLPGAAEAYVGNWTQYVHSLTVKQLRQLTGKTNSRFNKASLQYIAMCM